MLIPMITIALICIIFGVFNFIPLKYFIQPSLSTPRLEGYSFCGFHYNTVLVAITIAVLLVALLNHLFGFIKTGSGLRAVDHIHYAPVLSGIYDRAQRGRFDPYNIGLVAVKIVSRITWACDRAVDWVYNIFSVKLAYGVSGGIKRLHNGNYAFYILWSFLASAGIIIFLLRSI